ncbi:isoflavone reductase family protein [Colletotrichum chrysophilum]|uniref:Isoflavone reductase family protein n=1 Tax=Colletotrichum chrysophilum TaxID=1836956 RepID=A0AAD9AWT2_9PEZI|nr:isoflavone reductase family protein [Colletotrichum chrysophilum]
MRVSIIGATGETGQSIIDGLLKSTEPKYGQDITALTRPASMQKPEVLDLQKKGIHIVAANLEGPEDALTEILKGTDVMISAINAGNLMAQIPLINASKAAGVGRFIPCFFATIVPPKGILKLRDIKEDVLNHVKKVRLPYTAIDVGWWYQITLPRLASGRIDYATTLVTDGIGGDGNMLSAITDVRDIGTYVARIIADPRTLNHMVFAYNELITQNQVYDLLEKMSGEKVKRNHVSCLQLIIAASGLNGQQISVEAIKAGVAQMEASNLGPESPEFYELIRFQYWHSWAIRGDNTPEYAKYLGYLNTKDLYPDIGFISFQDYVQEVLDGKGKSVYEKSEDLKPLKVE